MVGLTLMAARLFVMLIAYCVSESRRQALIRHIASARLTTPVIHPVMTSV